MVVTLAVPNRGAKGSKPHRPVMWAALPRSCSLTLPQGASRLLPAGCWGRGLDGWETDTQESWGDLGKVLTVRHT